MKNEIHKLVLKAYENSVNNGKIPEIVPSPIFVIEKPKTESHGDFSTNIALVLAPLAKRSPREIAKILQSSLQEKDHLLIEKIEVAGPGFINFFMQDRFWLNGFRKVLESGSSFGRIDFGKGEKALVEFVSANPTGPLHVGHGRGAVVGDVIANILNYAGFDVHKEYYINDVGLQMVTLGKSTYIRYRQLFGEDIMLPEDAYQGEYIKDIASQIKDKHGDTYLKITEEKAISFFSEYSSRVILDEICEDLKKINITFDKWYSEKTLNGCDDKINKVDEVVKWMREKDFIYEKDDALWLKATAFNDEKDRVVKRGTGVYTYLASDIAYHKDKIERGYKLMVDVWGADHHGYVPRLQAAIGALGFPEDILKIVLIQLVNLKKGGELISMSTRRGKFTCLSDLVREVGSDATRFFFLMRSSDAQLEFDVDLATKNSSENPVYYVQYAYARIGSIFRQAAEQGVSVESGDIPFEKLNGTDDLYLIKKILAFPDLVERMAKRLEPHLITHYIHDLVSDFHSFYNKHRVISDDSDLTRARLMLLKGVQIVIKNSLNIMGVSAPEKM